MTQSLKVIKASKDRNKIIALRLTRKLAILFVTLQNSLNTSQMQSFFEQISIYYVFFQIKMKWYKNKNF